MATESAIVLTDGDKNMYVVPAEFITGAKVDPKSHEAVLKNLSDKPKNISIGSDFTFIGEISRLVGGEWPAESGDVAWPHFVLTK